MTLQPRPYQQAAVDACWFFLSSQPGNPLIVLPTGAGKSLVMAMLCQQAVTQWGCRVGVLAHVKELIEQNAAELKRLAPEIDVGIYSAGLKRRDKHAAVICAGIQSVYAKACEFEPFDLLLIDECHLVPPDGEGMYRQFIQDATLCNPRLRIIGLTATPYRTSTGLLYGDGQMFDRIAYEAHVADLITQGYLCPLTSKQGAACDTSGLRVRGGEYVDGDVEALMLDTVAEACRSLVDRTRDRNSVLVFCSGVAHAEAVVEQLRALQGDRVELITGETSASDRGRYVELFRHGEIKYLVNVNVLATGFNAPNVDCIPLLRPTLSPGLYYQMVGRGFRIAEGKADCLVLDYGGNVLRHGPVDAIKARPRSGKWSGEAPAKVCPTCEAIIPAGVVECPDCGHTFERELAKHDEQPGDLPVTTLEVKRETHVVKDVKYSVHRKRGDASAPPTLRVSYVLSSYAEVSEWVCIEHDGFAGRKARQWWSQRSNDPYPDTVARAVDVANGGGLAIPLEITTQIKGGEKWPRVTKVVLGPKPEGVTPADGDDFDFAALAEEPAQTDIDYDQLTWG